MSRYVTALVFLGALRVFAGSPQPAEVSVLRAVPPTYPEIADFARPGGTIRVQVSVGADGRVRSARALPVGPRNPTDPDYFRGVGTLRKASEAAAQKWLFAPSTQGIEDRSAIVTFTYDRRLESSTKSSVESTFVPPLTLRVVEVVGRIRPLPANQPKVCPVHGTPLERDVVPIKYGLMVDVAPVTSPVSVSTIGGGIVLRLDETEAGSRTTTFVLDPTEAELESVGASEVSYDEARRKYFPYARRDVGGGCIVMDQDRAEVLVCRTCSAIERRWYGRDSSGP